MRITHGRGITDGTLTKLVHVLPRSISICDALEQFTDVHTITSEQYKDLRQSTQARDARDRYMFVECCMHIRVVLIFQLSKCLAPTPPIDSPYDKINLCQNLEKLVDI